MDPRDGDTSVGSAEEGNWAAQRRLDGPRAAFWPRAGRNARGSLARSVHGQLGSARIGSFEFFHELS